MMGDVHFELLSPDVVDGQGGQVSERLGMGMTLDLEATVPPEPKDHPHLHSPCNPQMMKLTAR